MSELSTAAIAQMPNSVGPERAAPPAPRPPTRVRSRTAEYSDSDDDERYARGAPPAARRRTTRMPDDSDDELMEQPPAGERALTRAEKTAAWEAWRRAAPYENKLAVGDLLDYPASGVEYKCIVGKDDRLIMISANQQYAERDAVEVEVGGAAAVVDSSAADQALKSINDLLADKAKILDAREKRLVARENAVQEHEKLFECAKELTDVLQPAIHGRGSRHVMQALANTLELAMPTACYEKLGSVLYCGLRDMYLLTHGEESLGMQWNEYRDEAMRKYTLYQKLVKDDKMDPSAAIEKVDSMHHCP